MASVTDIYNMVLYRVGSSKVVGAPTETSKEARTCEAFYPTLRDYALRDYDWNFARRRKVLALSTASPATNWLYAYTLPSDCVKTRRLVTVGTRTPKIGERSPFEVAGNMLFTDLPDAELIYTARIEDATQFDPMFVSALAWLMVPDVAMGLVLKVDAAQAGRQNYRVISNEAMAADMNEGFDEEPTSDFLAERI